MADSILLNQVFVDGTYDSLPLGVDTNALSTLIVTGIVATKSADKAVWVDGELTFSIVIDNQADEDFVTPTLTDVLDITLIKLVDNSVEVGGVVSAYTYNDLTGLLTVVLPTIEAGDDLTITFKVEMI